MSNSVNITLPQALKILQEIAAHPTLKLSLAEHSAVQQSLQVVGATIEQLTSKPEDVAPPLPELGDQPF